MGAMFSVMMPLIAGFAALTFTIRFYIEKYNFVFVYITDYDSQGRMINSLISFQIFGVIIFQMFNYTYIAINMQGYSSLKMIGYIFVAL